MLMASVTPGGELRRQAIFARCNESERVLTTLGTRAAGPDKNLVLTMV